MDPAVREALEFDVAQLFTLTPTAFYGLKEFSMRWKHLDFSLIHYCCQEADLRCSFMDLLYSLLMEYFTRYPKQCIFALYLTYFSQPDEVCAKIPIPVTIQMLKQFIGLSKSRDISYVLNKLLKVDAFVVLMQNFTQENDLKANFCAQGKVHVDRECAIELRKASEHLCSPLLKEDLNEIHPQLLDKVQRIIDE
jgi:hypothetical protein